MKSSILLVCAASFSVVGCASGRPAATDASSSLAAPVSVVNGAVEDSRVDFTIAGGFATAKPVAMAIIAQPICGCIPPRTRGAGRSCCRWATSRVGESAAAAGSGVAALVLKAPDARRLVHAQATPSNARDGAAVAGLVAPAR